MKEVGRVEFQEWMKEYERRVGALFGDRLVCLGLQGSRGRGEAAEDSDIDVVMILDRLTMEDLRTYDEMLNGLPQREKVCGFVSGRDELECWEKSDLFQFCRDTTVLRGSLDFIASRIVPSDVRRAVRIGACNLYHGAVHNRLHDKSPDALCELYKAAFFLLQALHYEETGEYVRTRAELAERRPEAEREILRLGQRLRSGEMPEAFESLSGRLIALSGQLIRSHGE